jgi:hypothetical protein
LATSTRAFAPSLHPGSKYTASKPRAAKQTIMRFMEVPLEEAVIRHTLLSRAKDEARMGHENLKVISVVQS